MSVQKNVADHKTKNQHYVPRCYMKNFARVVGEGKKEKAFIGFYQFDKDIFRDGVPTKTVCYEEYFYGEDGKIENEFARKETTWGSTLKKICKCSDWSLDEEDEKQIKNFAIYQYERTLAIYKHHKDMMSEILATHFHNNIPILDEAKIRQITDEKLENEINAAQAVEICNKMLDVIDDLQLSIIRYETKEKLITSDMPIIMMNPFCPSKAGMSNVGVMIFFPISNNTLAVIFDKKIYRLDKFIKLCNEKDVENLNKYQVISAEERVLSVTTEDFKKYVYDLELLDERKQYQDKRKTASGFDGRGTFFATKPRNLKYNYVLSFCTLPHYLRKIPINCRDVFERRYSREARFNLLFTVYRMPELLKKNHGFSAKEIAKRKYGYSEMQRFMDDYWEIPTAGRTISPKLMQKLKNVSLEFFPIDRQ